MRTLLCTLTALMPLMAFGRPFQIVDPKTLLANSKLVFVGKVRSVKASGIATPLNYPTWEGVSFPWLSVKVEVLEPFKGVQKGDIVQVMMLSIHNSEDRPLCIVRRMCSNPARATFSSFASETHL
jgi:hypothetical protein